VNRGLEKGRVKLEKGEFIRIIQEAIYERIMKDLPLNVPADVCNAIRGYTEEIKRELEETRKKFGDAEGFIVKDPNCFPPLRQCALMVTVLEVTTYVRRFLIH
jgi:DNA primase large subunit